MDVQLITASNGTVIGAHYYRYQPSEGAGWTYLVFFAGMTLAHFILMFPFRAAFFIPMIIGGISESPTFPVFTSVQLRPSQSPCSNLFRNPRLSARTLRSLKS
jgi:hypothetical protein